MPPYYPCCDGFYGGPHARDCDRNADTKSVPENKTPIVAVLCAEERAELRELAEAVLNNALTSCVLEHDPMRTNNSLTYTPAMAIRARMTRLAELAERAAIQLEREAK